MPLYILVQLSSTDFQILKPFTTGLSS